MGFINAGGGDVRAVASVAADMPTAWTHDSHASSCMRCSQIFNPFWRRKHHCRACGFVVCDDCAPEGVR